MNRILRLREVMRRTSLARSTIYLFVSQDRFPPPIPLAPKGARYVCGWLESEVEGWISEQAAARPPHLSAERVALTNGSLRR